MEIIIDKRETATFGNVFIGYWFTYKNALYRKATTKTAHLIGHNSIHVIEFNHDIEVVLADVVINVKEK